MSNLERSILGEFLVAMALGLEKHPRLEWNAYDLKTPSGLTIEIKTSATKQSWPKSKPLPIRFGIAPHTSWDAETNETDSTVQRSADLYVFCVLRGDDPLDMTEWRFYVLSTAVLNQQLPNQKSIVYRPRVLGQWFDGIRFYAAASSPTRSRRT